MTEVALILIEFLARDDVAHDFDVRKFHGGKQLSESPADGGGFGTVFFLGGDPLVPMCAHARAHTSGHEPLQFWMLVH